MNFYFKKLFFGLNLLTILMITVSALAEDVESTRNRARLMARVDELVAQGRLTREDAVGMKRLPTKNIQLIFDYAGEQ